MSSTSQDLHEHLLCGKSAFYAKKEPVLYISISHYTFLYNIKVQYPIVKRGVTPMKFTLNLFSLLFQ